MTQARNQSTDLLVILLGERAYKWGIKSKYRKLNKQLATLRLVVKEIIRNRANQVKDNQGSLQKYTDIYEALHLLHSKDGSNLSSFEEDEIIE